MAPTSRRAGAVGEIKQGLNAKSRKAWSASLSKIEYIVPNFLARGRVTLIHGDSGSGKSTLVKTLVTAVDGVGDFLGHNLPKLKTLFIQKDEGVDWTFESLEKMGLRKDVDEADEHIWVVEENYSNDLVADIRHHLKAHPDTDLLIVDSLGDLLSGIDSMNDYSDVRRVFSDLRKLFTTYPRLAVLLVHHSTKQGSYNGSMSIKESVDFMFKITLNRDNTSALETEKARMGERLNLLLGWNPDTHRLTVNKDKSISAEDRLDLRVIEFLSGRPERTATYTDIRTNVEGKNAAIQGSVNRLVGACILKQEGTGKKGNPRILTLQGNF